MTPLMHAALRVSAAILVAGVWIIGTDWGYTHAIELRMQRREAQAQAVIHARDMEHLRDLQQLRDCQMRVLESYDYQQTDLMIARSALKHARMER